MLVVNNFTHLLVFRYYKFVDIHSCLSNIWFRNAQKLLIFFGKLYKQVEKIVIIIIIIRLVYYKYSQMHLLI